ncbi:MAG: chemotaxis protein CheX [Acidobacteriota bacterium]
MIEQDVLVRSMTEATSEVFSMMLDMRTEFAGFARDAKGSETGLIGFVGITGAWGGSGLFCCSPALAGVICDRMLGGDRKTSIDEEVLDVVAEVTNMMIGNVKNALEVMTGPMAISVPTVIHGRNFQFRNAVGLRGAALSFTTGGERFEVRITLAPASEQGFARSRISVPGLASVQGGPDGGRFVPASHLAEENSRAEIE